MIRDDVFYHSTALVETQCVGSGTRIWAYTHILAGAEIGSDCNICDHVFIEGGAKVGNEVTIKCGVQLWDGVEIEDGVFIGPNATFTNDPFPRSKEYPDEFSKTVVQTGASIGANATILPGLVIGRFAMVGAGAVVTHDIPPYATVVGNPARIRGYSTAVSNGNSVVLPSPADDTLRGSCCRGVAFCRFPRITDMRGVLTFGEFPKHLPFEPKRFFVVQNVPSEYVRGQHAHRKLEQVLVCLSGSVSVMVDDGKARDQFTLDSPSLGVHISNLVWSTQFRYSKDCILVVFASDIYDEMDYIRDYSEFLSSVSARK